MKFRLIGNPGHGRTFGPQDFHLFNSEQTMTHCPDRERHMIHKCEKCRCIVPAGEMYHNKDFDEYWCESCVNNANEAAYDRQQESNLESPPESAREEQLRTWTEKQKLNSRDACKERQAFDPLTGKPAAKSSE